MDNNGLMSPKPVVTMPDESWIADVNAPHDVDLEVWDVATSVAEALGPDTHRVVAVVLPYLGGIPAAGDLHNLPNLTLVQSLTAGYDNLLGLIPVGVSLANAAGVHDASTAELAVGLVLASLRGIDQAAQDAAAGRWNSVTRTSLADRRVLMIGIGGVGSAVIRRLEPFEVSITRVGSTARDDDHGHVHSREDITALLPHHDVVIVTVPLTEHTRGLVNAAFLAAMPDDALLVNVGRGPVADTDALLQHADRLHLALDVTDPEPLPSDHPLWKKRGVLITPHLGGDTTAFRPRAVGLLNDLMGRIARDEPPKAIVLSGSMEPRAKESR